LVDILSLVPYERVRKRCGCEYGLAQVNLYRQMLKLIGEKDDFQEMTVVEKLKQNLLFSIAYWRYNSKIIQIGEAVRQNCSASPIVTELTYKLRCTGRKRKYVK
jgi:hypothetical protein